LIKLLKKDIFRQCATKIKEWFLVKCVEDAQAHLKKHFGTIRMPLGDLQKLVRGKKELPVGGIPDVIAPCGFLNIRTAHLKRK
jgi:hypothetical protein